MSLLKSANDNQQFFVVDLVIALCERHNFKHVNHQMKQFIWAYLRKHDDNHEIEGIAFDSNL